MAEHVFLYGTLLPELAPAGLQAELQKLERVGPGRARGTLYDLGEYPGLILEEPSGPEPISGAGAPPTERDVQGTVFKLPEDPSVLQSLDAYEGFLPDRPAASLFRRERGRAALEGGGELEVWLYVYNRDPGAAPAIPGGNYLSWSRGGPSPRPMDTGGLPFRERAFAGFLIRSLGLFFSPGAITRGSVHAVKGLEEIVAGIPDEALCRRTTIPRVPGIEESTRHWSLSEVAEHVLIVNRRFLEVSKCLGRGDDPGHLWTILDVKPRGRPVELIRRELTKLPGEIEVAAKEVRDWRSPLRHPHPWFGALNAREWWVLNALHNRIHRRQAARILDLLV